MAVWMLFMFAATLATVQSHRLFTIDVERALPLDMAPDSVDDAFNGCVEKMSGLVKNRYLKRELNANQNFKDGWKLAEKRAKPDDGLKKEHAVALWVYTSSHPNVYADFNKAVGNGKGSYMNNTFQYYSLHFLLTDALRLLKEKQKSPMTTYRRTKDTYDRIKVGKTIRFGRFASTSLDYNETVSFGDKTCFEIDTHFGADITKFSALKNREKEVLIPPYEKFKVTSIHKKEDEPNLWCDLVYKVESDNTQSNLNCAVANKVH
ncbi:ecto-ADP-ribosyltransferase 5-like [Chanos chanos]|uniref:NAD(P)(+)--arginine ADP-ribosyltransferase n=1 Tax=Chanos chanos TaxID=29144 RepID=A0A6J2VSE8_CHACN|nr:ecto-ADP-ribosyltransferase 5-like [Chanos chanos]